MVEVIGVRFKDVGKIYYFDASGNKVNAKSKVIVETARGIEMGEVVLENFEIDETSMNQPLKKVLRIATDEDLKKAAINKAKEADAFKICAQKIKDHKLEMKLTEVEYAFDGSKILFYFTADGRIDFRDLVKDLAFVFKTRIELRQIGVRDEAKLIGGLGICGRKLCCSTFLGEFAPVSIKMAKEQSLSLNPTKISGTCGRLMCCLKYEEEAYQDLLRKTPKPGAFVKTPDGKGNVVDTLLLRGLVKVKLEKDENVRVYSVSDIKIIKDSVIEIKSDEINALKDLEDN